MMDSKDLELLREEVASRLSPRRMAHVLGCEEMAGELAGRWGADVQAARQAALLHDVTKEVSQDGQLLICAKYGILLKNVELCEPKLLHAITGAAVARFEFCAPEPVCGAVRWHTTGREGMTLLEKILYLADYVEPGRTFQGVEEIRRRAFENLDGAILDGLGLSISLIVGRGRLLHPATVEARNDLLIQLKGSAQ